MKIIHIHSVVSAHVENTKLVNNFKFNLTAATCLNGFTCFFGLIKSLNQAVHKKSFFSKIKNIKDSYVREQSSVNTDTCRGYDERETQKFEKHDLGKGFYQTMVKERLHLNLQSHKQKKKQQKLCIERKVKEDVWTRVTFPRHPSFL